MKVATTCIAKGIGGIQVLRGISTQLRRGGIVAVVGRNGAGKTTLLRPITAALAH